MTRIKKLSVLFLVFLLLLSGCKGKNKGEMNEGAQPAAPGTSAVSQSEGESTTESTGAAEAQDPVVAHLVVAGDIMSHVPQNKDAYVASTQSYDFNHMIVEPAVQLRAADYAVGNLETVFGGGPNYSGYPTFNTPDALATAVKNAGFDLVSTANNHTRDQGMDGITRTLDVLDENGIAHVGTYRSKADRDATNGIYVADVGGISTAFLCYTYGLNGFSLPEGKEYAANVFNNDYTTTVSDFNYDLVDADMAAARAMDTDLIAVIIHWGIEYQTTPNDYQKSIAKHLAEQGADIILGGHPHVLQPYETITATDTLGNEKETFVIYSFGNFISNQTQYEPATQSTILLDLELTKNPATGKTKISGVSYTPYFMLHRDDLPAGQQRMLVDMHKAIREYEAGTSKYVGSNSYQKIKNALEFVHKIMGSEGDKAA